MTYEETLEKIHEFGKFGSKLGLERMITLMEYLGNPQDKLKAIHVAGTNGKGSVCRYLYSVLLQNGYGVGLYTSPYLEKFTERMECNGELISEQDLASCTEEVLIQVDRLISDGFESPTEFEVITAIAFLYFWKKRVDYVVLEVGLGGRGDSTNIIQNPLITVITSISFDHMEYLGDTLEKIAFEKAGIIKEDAPIVCNVKDAAATEVIASIAKKKNALFYNADRFSSNKQFNNKNGDDGYTKAVHNVIIKNTSMDAYHFSAEIMGENYEDVMLSMIGEHQVENALCALTVLEILKKEDIMSLSQKMILKGMLQAKQIGRLEVLQKNPFVIIDGAHNDAGAKALSDSLQKHFKGKKILLFIGMLADKEVDKMINDFAKTGAVLVATEPDNPRKLRAEDLCLKVNKAGFDCKVGGLPKNAVQYAKEKQTDFDVIVFAGSLYLIGKIREIWKHEEYEGK
ncbi:bifunctional folylpolyglutamate synthase/dihydrofolate synthase [Anaerovorax sp. IOR16]|uniref:bifunctional folylpolyglutamate synthase/dihydrofolate synthase n=1 Tax=Anaerovorax sp. IOR16 TaxID=2773458 RepID=UPI001FD6763C|nr:folylpolyglutamate synthase/dihydrofolate synthase family protein [Anaerovorax sp. IOR16]